MRRFLTVLAAAGLSLILSSCAGVAEPAAESTGSPSPTPPPTVETTPTPDPNQVAADIVVSGDQIVVIALDGSELAAANFFTDRDLLVQTLTDALGAEPAIATREGGHEWWPGLIYDWNGISLFLADGEWDQFASDVTRLEVTAATVNGVAIHADADITVGTPISELDPSAPSGPTEDGSYFYLDATTVGTSADLGPGGDPTSPLIASVVLYADSTAVIRFVAPATNWGV
ncbi:MAG: hypothetical protein RLZZ608_1202 [Actinomycetota bacterium]|jgi:hypothetical protein